MTGAYQYSNDIATALPVVLNEQGPDGNIDYAYGLGLIEENSAGFNYFYHYDGLRSVVALTDSLGKPQAAYAYDPWGIPLLAISDRIGTRNKFRFGGESLDQGTGLYFLRARYYDPMLGRFTKPDPYHGSAFHAISMRRFLYANNNPVRYLDPSGLLVYGVSLGIEGDVGGGVNGEVSLVYDDKGNRALAVTGGFSVGLGISGGSSLFLTNDATIDQFAGRSLSLGGSVGPLDAAVLLDSSGYFEGAVLGVAKGGLDVNISFTWTGLVGRNAWWVPGSPVNWSWVRNTLGQIESDLGSTPTNAQSIK